MIFKAVNEVPDKKRTAKHDLRGLLKEFVEGDKAIVQVVLIAGDYKSPLVCYKCLQLAVKNYKLPVKVHYRDGEVYLAKK